MVPVKREVTKESPEGSSKRLCTPAIRQQFGRDCSIRAGEDEIAGGVPYVVHVRRRGTAKGDSSRDAPSSSSRDTPTTNSRPPSRSIPSGKSEDPVDLTDESLLGKREESPLHIDLTWDEEDESKPTLNASVPPPNPSIPPSGATTPSPGHMISFSRTAGPSSDGSKPHSISGPKPSSLSSTYPSQSTSRSPASQGPRSGRPMSRNATPGPSRLRGQPMNTQPPSRAPPSAASNATQTRSPSVRPSRAAAAVGIRTPAVGSRTGSSTPSQSSRQSLSPSYISSDSESDSSSSEDDSERTSERQRKRPTHRTQGRRTFPDYTIPHKRPDVDLWPAASVPKAAHAAARRILVSSASKEYPIMTVSRRGDLQFFRPYEPEDEFEAMGEAKLTRLAGKSIPSEGRNLIEDACVTAKGRMVVAYHNGPVQIAYIEISSDHPRLIPALENAPHTPITRKKRPDTTTTCLTPAVGPGKDGFFTGGWDKHIFSWAFDHDPTDADTIDLTAESSDMDISDDEGDSSVGAGDSNAGADDSRGRVHTAHGRTTTTTASSSLIRTKVLQLAAVPRALANAGNRLFVGYQQTLVSMDLARPAAALATSKLSNSVQQMHVNKAEERVIMLETDHRDHQNQLYDTREGFDKPPVVQFGHRTHEQGHTFYKGDFWLSYFVRGYPDHSLRVWDIRNVKTPVLTRTTSCVVTHAVFQPGSAGTVLAFGKSDVFCTDVKRDG
ncbi:uncharacterized protein SCHCODRAFT_02540143 [Schizophyllum commune H4-8]|nr:uncharacterized protein SCHCODRAFT_02540143 [Schizophyllum commune H4-8]KAI5894071.1 hypothetical protein SCHCODRAFT_02540143 [Schizophyllum commune H4-8]